MDITQLRVMFARLRCVVLLDECCCAPKYREEGCWIYRWAEGIVLRLVFGMISPHITHTYGSNNGGRIKLDVCVVDWDVGHETDAGPNYRVVEVRLEFQFKKYI